MIGKKPLVLLLPLVLVGAALYSCSNLGIVDVSAAPLSPYIMITPEQTVNYTISLGMNFTIEISTDYDGSDVWGWQFELFFSPDVLEGLEVRNGDLITTAKNTSARFYPGLFDNTLGHLDITTAFFRNYPMPPATTSGPGTLAYVTFKAKGTGISNITLGEALIQGFQPPDSFPFIIDQNGPPGATEPPYGVDHIGHGACTCMQFAHDVAVVSVSASPQTVFVGELIEIEVRLQNSGANNETFEVEVTYDASAVAPEAVTSMLPGNLTSLWFTWNTTGVDPGPYTITAEAMLAMDENPTNDKKTASVQVEPPLGSIEGIVEDANTDSPIAGVTVTTGTYTNTTNADGYYKVSDVPAGIYTVTASKDGFQTTSKTSIGVVAGQTTNLDFTLTLLPTNGNIAGVVSDASTGNPIEAANVTTNDYFNITDANGHYNISNIPAGIYTVTASKDGYESSFSTNIVVTAGQTTTVDIQLTPKQSSSILLYVIVAVVAIIVIAGIAFFVRNKMRKTE